jgi:D-3-phosphoglycerate dehydrogenase
VTLHVPETTQTKNMIDKRHLELMKPTAYLINTSRGSVVDANALTECLKQKTIQGAAIDVFTREPATNQQLFESPLRGLENVVLTPHIGGSTQEASENILMDVVNKLSQFFNQGTTEGSVNFPSLLLPVQEIPCHRILHIHENKAGMLEKINKAIAKEKINIVSQYLKTNQEIGYLVLDIEHLASHHLLEILSNIEGTIRTRLVF